MNTRNRKKALMLVLALKVKTKMSHQTSEETSLQWILRDAVIHAVSSLPGTGCHSYSSSVPVYCSNTILKPYNLQRFVAEVNSQAFGGFGES